MGDWKNWSEWLKEGYYVSYPRANTRYYEHIVARDLAHYVYDWHEAISAGSTSGPTVPESLVVTKGYDSADNTNRIWQMIFGIDTQASYTSSSRRISIATAYRRYLSQARKPGRSRTSRSG